MRLISQLPLTVVALHDLNLAANATAADDPEGRAYRGHGRACGGAHP